MPSTRSLVTGGAGFTGLHVVRRLLEHGQDGRVVDNLITGFRQNLEEIADRIDFRVADIRDRRSCDEAIEGVETIFHVAALPSVPRSMADPIGTHETNADGTLNLLEE